MRLELGAPATHCRMYCSLDRTSQWDGWWSKWMSRAAMQSTRNCPTALTNWGAPTDSSATNMSWRLRTVETSNPVRTRYVYKRMRSCSYNGHSTQTWYASSTTKRPTGALLQ